MELTVHPVKTKIVYCKKDGRRSLKNKPVQFDSLGISCKPMIWHLKQGGHFLQFDCTTSRKSKGKMLSYLRDLQIGRTTGSTLEQISRMFEKQLQGWYSYGIRGISPVFYYIHQPLMSRGTRRYKSFKGSRVLASKFLKQMYRFYPYLFRHWTLGYRFL